MSRNQPVEAEDQSSPLYGGIFLLIIIFLFLAGAWFVAIYLPHQRDVDWEKQRITNQQIDKTNYERCTKDTSDAKYCWNAVYGSANQGGQ